MTPAGKVRFAFFIVALLTLLFGVVVVLKGLVRRPAPAAAPTPAPTNLVPESTGYFEPPAEVPALPREVMVKVEDMQPAAVLDDMPSLAPPLPLQKGDLEWEVRINSVVNNPDLSDAAKARRLLEMLPALPADAWQSATEMAVERVTDDVYNSIALPWLLNPGINGMTHSVLFADLMERPDEITLPALLAIARQNGHPYAPHARENLDLLLGQDFGTDWPKWQESIRRHLAMPSAPEPSTP